MRKQPPSARQEQTNLPHPTLDLLKASTAARSRTATQQQASPGVCTCCGKSWSALGAAHCSICHGTFSTARYFDLHRHARGELGGCSNPAEITNSRGERIMFFRDGLWRGPVSSEEQQGMKR